MKNFSYNIKSFNSVFKFHTILLFFLLLFPIQNLFAAFERIAQPTILRGRGLSSIATDSFESFLLNPSTLSTVTSFNASLFYSPSPFGLSQLSNGGVMLSYPFSFGVTGFSISSVGFSAYKELTATFAFSRIINNFFSVGMNCNINNLSIAKYGSTTVVGIDIAGTVKLTESIKTGFSLLNINRPTLGKIKEPLPQVYSAGIAYYIFSTSVLSLDVVKDIQYPVSLRIGSQFLLYDIVDVRLGINTQLSRYSTGIGIHYDPLRIDYAVTTHQELGLTHSVGISFAF